MKTYCWTDGWSTDTGWIAPPSNWSTHRENSAGWFLNTTMPGLLYWWKHSAALGMEHRYRLACSITSLPAHRERSTGWFFKYICVESCLLEKTQRWTEVWSTAIDWPAALLTWSTHTHRKTYWSVFNYNCAGSLLMKTQHWTEARSAVIGWPAPPPNWSTQTAKDPLWSTNNQLISLWLFACIVNTEVAET